MEEIQAQDNIHLTTSQKQLPIHLVLKLAQLWTHQRIKDNLDLDSIMLQVEILSHTRIVITIAEVQVLELKREE
jgi:hypothetical protein